MRSDELVYAAGGIHLASRMPLSPLPLAPNAAPDWRIEVTRTRAPGCRRWFHHWTTRTGDRWLSLGRYRSGYLLRFRDLASFQVDVAARTVRCHTGPGRGEDALRYLLLNQVLPLLVAGPNRVALHASAVAGPAGVIAFVGPGGSGKSTLAAAFVRRGWTLVTDDVLVVSQDARQVVVAPTFCELRLWPDAVRHLFGEARGSQPVARRSVKRRLGPESVARWMSAPARLARLYLIEPGAGARAVPGTAVVPCSPREAMVGLTRCTFVLDIGDRTALRTTFDQLAAIVERVEVAGLRCPQVLDRLDEIVDLVGKQESAYGASASRTQRARPATARLA